jgi:hypothetical protein
VRDYERLPRDPEEEPLARESEPVADVLQLQRSAGNRAVSSLLARQPSAEKEKAATMTAGLGDDIGVIPIDSFGWGQSAGGAGAATGKADVHEVSISFEVNAAAPAIAQAVAAGTPIPAAFVSTQKQTIDFTDVLLANFTQNDRGITVTLNFKSMKIRE